MLQQFLVQRFFLEWLLRYVSDKRYLANLMANIIAHNRRWCELYKLLNPFFQAGVDAQR